MWKAQRMTLENGFSLHPPSWATHPIPLSHLQSATSDQRYPGRKAALPRDACTGCTNTQPPAPTPGWLSPSVSYQGGSFSKGTETCLHPLVILLSPQTALYMPPTQLNSIQECAYCPEDQRKGPVSSGYRREN